MNQIPPNFKLLWAQNKAVIISLFLLSVFYLLTRLQNLTLLPIFVDEAIYIRWAQVMRAEPTLRFLSLTDGKQPLFMWLMIPFLKVIEDPLLAGRLLSVFTGLGSLIGVFFLTLQLFKSQKIALTASLLYAIVPFVFFFDRMALVDGMLMMFGTWAMCFSLQLIKQPRLDLSFLTGGLIGAAWLTKSPAMFFLGLMPIGLVTNPLQIKKNIRKSKKFLTVRKWYLIRLSFFWLVAGGIAFGIYNILRLGQEFHQIALRNADYLYPLKEVLDQPLKSIKPNLVGVWSFFWQLLTPSVLFVSLLGGWQYLKRKPKQVLFLMIWILVPLGGQIVFARTTTARYFLYIVPPVLILASLGTQWLLNRFKIKTWKIIVAVSIFIPSLLFDYFLLTNPIKANLPRIERHGYLEEWTAGTGLREIAGYIKQEAKINSIVVGTEGFFGTMPDGLQIYFDKHPNVTILGHDPIVTEINQQLYNSLKENKVYFLVNSSRFKIYNPRSAGLQLIKAFPKAERPDGTRESLLFFELVSQKYK